MDEQPTNKGNTRNKRTKKKKPPLTTPPRAEGSRNDQRLAASDVPLQEGRRCHVPHGVGARRVRGAHPAVGERAAVGLSLDERAARKGDDGAGPVRGEVPVEEGVVLAGRDGRQRSEPV